MSQLKNIQNRIYKAKFRLIHDGKLQFNMCTSTSRKIDCMQSTRVASEMLC